MSRLRRGLMIGLGGLVVVVLLLVIVVFLVGRLLTRRNH